MDSGSSSSLIEVGIYNFQLWLHVYFSDAPFKFFCFFSVKLFERQCSESMKALLPDCEEVVNNSGSEIVLYDEPDLRNFPMNFEINVNNVFRRKDVMQTAIGIIVVRNFFEFKSV